jgi:hypothetical protein
VFSYGRNEGGVSGSASGTARPAVLDKLLQTTERVVQEIDSVEYGLSDIQGTTIVMPFGPASILSLCHPLFRDRILRQHRRYVFLTDANAERL